MQSASTRARSSAVEGAPRALGVRLEEPAVVGHRELEHDERPHLRAVVERGRPAAERREAGTRQVAQRRGTVRAADLVTELRVVGHSAARSDVEHRLAPARVVGEVGALPREAAAPALAEQDDEVHERQPHATHDDGLPGPQVLEVEVGGVAGRDVGQAGPARLLEETPLFRCRCLVEVALGEDDEVGLEGAAVRQRHPLAPPVVDDGDRTSSVGVDGDTLRQRVDDPAPGPVEVVGLHDARRERAGRHPPGRRRGVGAGGPLGEGRARQDRPRAPDRRVSEHGDVLRLGVHPEQRRLVRAPDAPPAGRVRVDDVDVDPLHRAADVTGVGAQPLDDPEGARARPDDDDATLGHAAPQS